jgi:hypothetical protein
MHGLGVTPRVGYACAVPRTKSRAGAIHSSPQSGSTGRVRHCWRAAVTLTSMALASTGLWGMPLAHCQADGPPAPIRVSGSETRPRRSLVPALEVAGVVERELAARAIALGEVDTADVASLLEHTDWTLRHLALDALARTSASRWLSPRHFNNLDLALDDPRVELRVMATRVDVLDRSSSFDVVLRAAEDPAPEVRLALVRELAALLNRPSTWLDHEGEVPARLLSGNDAAAELARRLAWTVGPSRDRVARAMPSLIWGGTSWLELQSEAVLAPGAWAALAEDYRARCGGDPFVRVVSCFAECLAQSDWRRGPLAHMLRDLATTRAERAVAAALLAHVRPLTTEESESLAAGAADVCAQFGADDAARVLLPAARLAPQGLAAPLLAALPGTEGETRELLVRSAAEALGPAALAELALDTDPELLVACARVALARGTTLTGDQLVHFAGHPDTSVREALFTLAQDALPSGRAAMAVPLLERMLTDPEPDLAAAAFRVLAGAECAPAPATEAALYRVWRALPGESTRRSRLRDLSRTARWPSFMDDLLERAAEEHAAELVELLAPLAADPRVREALARWFEKDVRALCAAHELELRLVYDGRAASVAKALAAARGFELDLDLTTLFEPALIATMHTVHPSGERSRAKLPKALVALLGVDARGRAALERVLAATNPRAPRRVRTEAAIVLAERLERRLGAAGTSAGGAVAQDTPEDARHGDALSHVLADALVDAVLESESELAVRAVRALAALPRPARELGVTRLLAQWRALGAESVRIALVEVAAVEPAHYGALQHIVDGTSDDTVAGALIEAIAASEHGRAASLAALVRFEEVAASGALSGEARARDGALQLSAEQALVRREAVLLGFARAAAPLPDEVAERVFVRPLAASRSDLLLAFHGESSAGAEFRFRGELAIGEALAREERLAELLVRQRGASPSNGHELGSGALPAEWWEVDADFLTELARRAARHEPAAGARLAEAALVAHMGLPDARRERNGRGTRTELLALWLAAETAAGEQRDAATDSPAAAEARAAHFERAASVASELVGALALTNLERGLAVRDSRGLDLRTIERLFGAHDPILGIDPRARLTAAIDQLAMLALLERQDSVGFGWKRVYAEIDLGYAERLARSREARALEDRIDARHAALQTEQEDKRAPERHPDRDRR